LQRTGIYVYICRLVVAVRKREEELASSNGLLGLELEGREEAQQLSRCTSSKLSS